MKKDVLARRERNRERNRNKKKVREAAQERDDIELVRDELRFFKKHPTLQHLLKAEVLRRPFDEGVEGGEIEIRYLPKDGRAEEVREYLDSLPLDERKLLRVALAL